MSSSQHRSTRWKSPPKRREQSLWSSWTLFNSRVRYLWKFVLRVSTEEVYIPCHLLLIWYTNHTLFMSSIQLHGATLREITLRSSFSPWKEFKEVIRGHSVHLFMCLWDVTALEVNLEVNCLSSICNSAWHLHRLLKQRRSNVVIEISYFLPLRLSKNYPGHFLYTICMNMVNQLKTMEYVGLCDLQ